MRITASLALQFMVVPVVYRANGLAAESLISSDHAQVARFIAAAIALWSKPRMSDTRRFRASPRMFTVLLSCWRMIRIEGGECH